MRRPGGRTAAPIPAGSPVTATGPPALAADAAPPALATARLPVLTRLRGRVMAAAAAAFGVAMVAVPATAGRGLAQPLAGAGLVLVAASVAGPLRHWRGTGALAAMAAVAGCAAGRVGTAGLAAEGLVVLGYLLLLDAPAFLPAPGARRWLRLQAPLAACGAAASAIVLAVLAVPVPASAWLVATGAAAAVAAAAAALPLRPARKRRRRGRPNRLP